MAGHQLPAINDFEVAVRGAPGGMQEENQTKQEERGLCLSARKGVNPKASEPSMMSKVCIHHLIGKGR